MNLADRLTAKMGPLPMWAWVAIGVAAVLGYRWYRNRQANAAGATGATGATGAIDPATGYVTGSPSDLAALAAQQNSAGIDPNTGLPYASGITSGQGDAGPIGPAGPAGATGAAGAAGATGATGAPGTPSGGHGGVTKTLGPWKSYPKQVRAGYHVVKRGGLYYEIPNAAPSAPSATQGTGGGGTSGVTGPHVGVGVTSGSKPRLGPWTAYPKQVRPGYRVVKIGKVYYEVAA